MPKIVIPSKSDWSISHNNDNVGDLSRCQFIDFSAYPGHILVGDKFLPHTVSDDVGLSAVRTATGFAFTNSFGGTTSTYTYVAACEAVYKVLATDFISGTQFAADALTGTPTSLSDAEIITFGKTSLGFDGLVVSSAASGDLWLFNRDISTTAWKASWWTATLGTNGLGQAAMSATVPHPMALFGNSPFLFIGDGNKLHSVNGLKATYVAADIVNSRLVFKPNYVISWIKTTSQRVFIGLYDSRSNLLPSLVEEYDPTSETVREIVIQEGATIGYLDGNELYIVDVTGRILVYNGSTFQTVDEFPSNKSGYFVFGMPHRNGIAVFNRLAYIALPASATMGSKFIGGIWTYSKEHKQLSLRHPVVFSRSSETSEGSLFDVGALFQAPSSQGWLLLGGKMGLTNSTYQFGIYSRGITATGSTVGVYGRFSGATSKIPTAEIEGNWRNVCVKYNPQPHPLGVQSGSSVVLKYRTTDKPNGAVAYTGTWVTVNTFTTSNSLTGVAVGDEIAITTGQGAGMTFHISSITGTTPKTITIDENPPVTLTGSFIFDIENWRKFGTITDMTKKNETLDIPENQAQWIQVKFEGRGLVEIEQLQLGTEDVLKVEK